MNKLVSAAFAALVCCASASAVAQEPNGMQKSWDKASPEDRLTLVRTLCGDPRWPSKSTEEDAKIYLAKQTWDQVRRDDVLACGDTVKAGSLYRPAVVRTPAPVQSAQDDEVTPINHNPWSGNGKPRIDVDIHLGGHGHPRGHVRPPVRHGHAHHGHGHRSHGHVPTHGKRDGLDKVRDFLKNYDGPTWDFTDTHNGKTVHHDKVFNTHVDKHAPSTAVPCVPPGYNRVVLCNPRKVVRGVR